MIVVCLPTGLCYVLKMTFRATLQLWKFYGMGIQVIMRFKVCRTLSNGTDLSTKDKNERWGIAEDARVSSMRRRTV